MACCQFHDRLDKKLHTHAYTGKVCGSHAVQIYEVPGNPGIWNPVANEETGEVLSKPEYCCFECPTLKANG